MNRVTQFLSLGRAVAIAVIAALLLVAILASSQIHIGQSVVAGGNAVDGRALHETGTDLQCARGSECGPTNKATKVAPSQAQGPKLQP